MHPRQPSATQACTHPDHVANPTRAAKATPATTYQEQKPIQDAAVPNNAPPIPAPNTTNNPAESVLLSIKLPPNGSLADTPSRKPAFHEDSIPAREVTLRVSPGMIPQARGACNNR